VEHHGGTVNLASAPGQGTTIRVRLPSADAALAARELHAQDVAPAADTERRDLMPIGVAAGGGAHVPAEERRSGEYSKEQAR